MMTRFPARIALTLAFAIQISSLTMAQGPDLVPPAREHTVNYWCTWYAQNYWIGRGTNLTDLKSVTNANARDELNEHSLFNPIDGWATTYLPNSRNDFIFLIDHGWQTKVDSERIAGGPNFFNLVTDPRDFPRYANLEPQERLLRFNADIKKLGWNSLGIWTRGNVTPEQARAFVQWSKFAGITYWKIDGGDITQFNSFQAKEEIYPELVLEYVTGAGGNINPKWNQELPSYPSVYEVGGTQQQNMLRVLQHTDVFRTYDASPLLMSSTTLRRTHDILKQTQQQPIYRGVLNIQDDCNIAIGLGVAVASKRHPNIGERLLNGEDLHHQLSGPRRMQKRINEADRFGRWSRIAAPFPAGEGVYLSSETELVDRCRFSPLDTWASQTYGKVVSQSAPAIMARNMPLPKVDSDGVEPDGVAPFVCATTYPNGATGIATEGRVSIDDRWFHPRAKVSVQIKDASKPIGVVGHYRQLQLDFGGSLEGVTHVWAQDLLASESTDIIDQVTIQGNTVLIAGELIDRIGVSAGDKGDTSAPGMVIQLAGESLPVAGDEFTPVVTPVESHPKVVQADDQYRGLASTVADPNGLRVKAAGTSPAVVLKRLPTSINNGSLEVNWTMQAGRRSGKQNGFLVLSSDEDANSALVAGAWIGADEITMFENAEVWEGPKRPLSCDGELRCRLEVNLDTRTAKLKINGVKMETAFTESITSVNYIGFGVQGAETVFSEPQLTKESL
ncbi:hypothetical protein SAMN06265222_10844 [Neorhodopirellula lusitana]|uniref:Uncharacterized protein n=1 Tax=Neorhodopirellula lusitana TaxID=445327 RepID=A0ABY1QCY7_9BACT|nr:hypothetical protein [Neorhodopirellula lusitana]SMP63301.1 hypothetical protein SAMN06265222_10844 [Neorhodopirellula lusitana]